MADGVDWMRCGEAEPVDLRTDLPHAARVYDVLLGGKTNYPADRQAAAALMATMPVARHTAWENRAFMHRAVDYLVREAGVRQFLDIGTGIPTPPNLHETAQRLDRTARVVYADNDPIVLAHSRALHISSDEGRTAYLEADIRCPERVLAHPEFTETLTLSEPIALMLLTVLHWLPDAVDPRGIVRKLMDALPSGSYLVVTHITSELDASVDSAAEGLSDKGASGATPRPRAEVLRFFDGLELVDPGLVTVTEWRPAADPEVTSPFADCTSELIPLYVGVARKS